MSNSRVVAFGIGFGIIVLAAVASFAIFLPKAMGDSGSGSISLPETLPGGFTALDVEAAWAGVVDQGADPATQAASFAARNTYVDEALSEAGIDGSSRWYGTQDMSTQAAVQFVNAPGGAFVPYDLDDPATALATTGQAKELVVVDGGICVETSSTGTDGATVVAVRECQIGNGSQTVQISTNGDMEQVTAIADALLN